MLKSILVLFSVIICSCSETTSSFDAESKYDAKILQDILLRKSEVGKCVLLPLDCYDEAIEYSRQGGYGSHHHVIRLLKDKERCIIQLIDHRYEQSWRKEETIYWERILQENQYNSIVKRIEEIDFNHLHLDSIRSVCDVVDCHLVMKDKKRIKGFKWQGFHGVKDNAQRPIVERQISSIVHNLLQMSGLQNGEKFIIPIDTTSKVDSIVFKVGISNYYTAGSDITGRYEGRRIDFDADGLGLIVVAKNDTFQLSNRVQFKIKTVDDKIDVF